MARFFFYILFLILIKAHLIIATSESPLMASRKLGKHNLSPSESPKTEEKTEENGDFAMEVSAAGGAGGDEEVMKVNHHRRHPFDKSVAGGGVIIGGLATTFLVAIFCYIRATRRKAVEPGSPTDSGSPTNSNSLIEKRSGELPKL